LLQKAVILGGIIWLVLSGSAIFIHAAQKNAGFVFLNLADKEGVWAASNVPAIEAARYAFTGALKYAPASESAWRGLGFVFMVQGQQTQAETAWKQATHFEQELWRWGQIDETSGDWSSALEKYQLSTTVSSELADGWYYTGRVHEQLGQSELAQWHYQSGLAQPLFLNIGKGDFYFRLGQIAASIKPPEWKTAVSYYDQALAARDFGEVREDQIRYARGVALRWSGRPREAMADFAWVTKNNPNHYWATIHLGMLTWLEEENATEAERLLQYAQQIKPENPYAYLSLAHFYQLTNHDSAAINTYQKLLTIDPTNQEAITQMALLKKNK